MSFLSCGQLLIIDSVLYRVAEHPAVTGYPYGQEGRQGTVYQLVSQEAGAEPLRALKVFKPWHRRPGLVSLSSRMKPFSSLTGLAVCRRTVVTPQQEPDLLREHPSLLYAVVMPWIEGPTWMEIMLDRRPLTGEHCLGLARSLASALTEMEQHILAHCDLSGANLLLPGLAPGARDPFAVALVDVEQIYGPGLDRPEALPGGSSGYAHKGATEGLWASNADRFAGAILLAEILGWCDEQIRNSAWGETYFDVHELPTGVPGHAKGDTERYQLLLEVLENRYGSGVAGLLDRAWHSENLAECATFGEWLMNLPQSLPKPARPALTPLQQMVQAAVQQEEQGRLPEALALYREALQTPEAGREIKAELAAAVRDLEQVLAPPAPQPLRTGPAPGHLPGESSAPAPVGFSPASEPPSPPAADCLPVSRPAAPAIVAGTVDRIAPLPPLEGRLTGVTQVAFSSDSASLAASSRDGNILLWATATGTVQANIHPFRSGPVLIAFSPADSLLVAGGPAGGIFLWDPRSGNSAGFVRAASADLTALTFSPGGELLAVGAINGTVNIWNWAQREMTDRFTTRSPVTALAFSPDGSTLCAASRDTITPWHPRGSGAPTGGGAAALTYHPDGATLFAGVVDGTVRRLRTAGFKSQGRLAGHSAAVTSLAVGDGLLASGSADRTVRLWGVDDGALIHMLRGHLHAVTCVSFSPDHMRLASSSHEGVRLWGIR